jgi:hypothetical protein
MPLNFWYCLVIEAYFAQSERAVDFPVKLVFDPSKSHTDVDARVMSASDFNIIN